MDYFDIDSTKSTPLYLQLADSIKRAIQSGRLRHDDILPTEKDLCNAFSCSRIVTQMAYDTLVKQSYVYRIQGKGTFVSHQPQRTVRIERILQIDVFGKIDHEPLTRSTVLHSVAKEAAPIAALLECVEMMPIIHDLRVFRVGSNPVLLQSCYVPVSSNPETWPVLTNEDAFFVWLEKATGQAIQSVKNRVGVIALEPWEAQILHVSKDVGAHICRSIVNSEAGKPIAYVETRLPATSFRIEITHHE
jgi:DNA-binding GntR family transcriptional regulator